LYAPCGTLVIPMSYINNSDMLGTVQNRFTVTGTVTLEKEGDAYLASARGHKSVGGCININGAASGMTDGSVLEFGGTKEKRVTATVTPTGDRYLYVEVDDES